MKIVLAAVGLLVFCTGTLEAAVKTQTIEYDGGGVHLKSFLAYDDAAQGKRPGIIVCPEWWGLTDYAKHRAEMLAELGYVALAVDLYGDGKTTDNPQEAGSLAGALKSNRTLLRQRVNAGLEQLKKNERVDPQKTGAIGYCFGGTTAIELARSGADIRGVVTFHAGLDSPNPADGKNIKARILVCHGGNDAFTPEKDLDAFEQEMRQNNVDWQINIYGGAVHSFTNPGADKHGIPGIAYNARADHRSWQAMQTFFNDVFAKGQSGQ
jgi:dienelactone hydrolase